MGPQQRAKKLCRHLAQCFASFERLGLQVALELQPTIRHKPQDPFNTINKGGILRLLTSFFGPHAPMLNWKGLQDNDDIYTWLAGKGLFL